MSNDEMTPAGLVWNRAAMSDTGKTSAAGDVALAALLRAHGLAMNGGVLHAVELLTQIELAAAKDGYRYFGFDNVADLFTRAQELFDARENLSKHERQLDDQYANYVPDDSTLVRRFKEHFHAHPIAFAPVVSDG